MISSAGFRPSQPEEAKKDLKYSVFLFLGVHIFLNFLGYRFSLPVLFLYSVLTNRQSAHFSVATLLILCKHSFFPVFILSLCCVRILPHVRLLRSQFSGTVKFYLVLDSSAIETVCCFEKFTQYSLFKESYVQCRLQ